MRKKLNHLSTVLKNRRWWPFYLQRQVLNAEIREFLSSIIAKYFRPKRIFKDYPINFGMSSEVKMSITELSTLGISYLGNVLSEMQACELREFFKTKLVYDPYRPNEKNYFPLSSFRNPQTHIAHHRPIDIINAPHLLSIANDPKILSIVEEILGCRPTLSYLAVWWSYATEVGPQQAEYFHRDVDDWRFIKLFIYLSDVTDSTGPHVYVRNSSNSKNLRKIERFCDENVERYFDINDIVKIKGLAGEGFLEDTFGIHKGQPVEDGHRLIFQAVYSMFPLPYSPQLPITKIQTLALDKDLSLDPWVNRLYIRK